MKQMKMKQTGAMLLFHLNSANTFPSVLVVLILFVQLLRYPSLTFLLPPQHNDVNGSSLVALTALTFRNSTATFLARNSVLCCSA